MVCIASPQAATSQLYICILSTLGTVWDRGFGDLGLLAPLESPVIVCFQTLMASIRDRWMAIVDGSRSVDGVDGWSVIGRNAWYCACHILVDPLIRCRHRTKSLDGRLFGMALLSSSRYQPGPVHVSTGKAL